MISQYYWVYSSDLLCPKKHTWHRSHIFETTSDTAPAPHDRATISKRRRHYRTARHAGSAQRCWGGISGAWHGQGVDLPAVSRCIKRGGPVNVRCSVTPKTGERLGDTRKSVDWTQTGITKAVIEWSSLPDTQKGRKMLEQYEEKLSHTVLRQGGE